MSNQSKFQSVIRGQAAALARQELPEFVCYCEESALPDQFCKIAVHLYRHDPELARLFVGQIVGEVIIKEKYSNPLNNQAKVMLYHYHSVFSLGLAIRGQSFEKDAEGLAMEYVLKAEQVSIGSSVLNRALILLYTGDLAECYRLAKKLEGELISQYNSMNHMLTIVQLLQAQCHFARRFYDKALECFRKCLIRNNTLPLKARIGMAYCYFYLNRFEMARACALRILQLDPRNTDAFICLAVVHERMEDYNGYFSNLKSAYKCGPSNPLLIYLIAEHLLIRGNVQKAQEMCLKGLSLLGNFSRIINRKQACRNDYVELESRFFNLQGQIEHKRKNFPLAIQFYSKAAEKGLLWNEVSLVQCLIGVQKYKEAMERMEYTYKVFEREKKDCRLLKDTYRIMAYLKNKCKTSQDPAKDAIYYYNEAIKFDKNDPSLKEELCYLLTVVELDKHKALRTMQELQKQLHLNGIEPKPQSLINMGVLLMENHEPEEGQLKLRKAIEMIEQWEDLDISQQRGFLIIAKYNYAICLERGNYNYKALQVLDEILKINRFHLNSLLQKALILHKIGDKPTALQMLSEAETTFQQRLTTQMQIDKIKGMKAYLLYLEGRYDESLEIISVLAMKRPDYVYYKVLQFAIRYDICTSQHGLAELLKTGKEYFEQICSKNNAELFCYMILATINASLGTLTKEQGTNLFKKILVSTSKIPAIRYNMGLFYMRQNDEEAAISCFNQHREGSHSGIADELIAHQYLINRDFKKCIRITKKSILLDPANHRGRAQLFLATHSRCEEELSNQKKQVVLSNHHQIKKCLEFYKFYERFSVESIKDFNAQSISSIIKQVCEQKLVVGQKVMEKYQKKAREIYQSEAPRGGKPGAEGGEESQNQDDKISRAIQEKKKKALALSKLKTQSVAESWNMISEKQKAAEEEKQKRKVSKEPASDASPKRRERPKDKREESARTEPEQYYSVSSKKERAKGVRREAEKEKEKEEARPEEQNLSKYMVD